MNTRLLIIVRAGSGSLHRAWKFICADVVDVAISLYEEAPVAADGFVIVHHCVGSKFQAMQDFFAANAWVLDAYTHYWFFDDDIYLPFRSLLAVQDSIERYGFHLCAPSLAQESFMSWPITVQNDAFHLRVTDFAEIMAPIMSRAFLLRALPTFAENYTAWGYEWLWRTYLEEMNTFAAILDAAPVVHTRAMGKGDLYKGRTGTRLSPEEEALALFRKYGIEKDAVPFHNLFGLASTDRQPILGPALLARARDGYSLLERYNSDYFARCQEALATAPPPLDSTEAIAKFAGGAALLSAKVE